VEHTGSATELRDEAPLATQIRVDPFEVSVNFVPLRAAALLSWSKLISPGRRRYWAVTTAEVAETEQPTTFMVVVPADTKGLLLTE
jgi:hypothetical protein